MATNFLGVEVSTGGGQTVIDEGTYDAVLSAIVQGGVHEREYQGKPIKPAMMIKLIFEIPSLTYEFDGQTQTTTVGKEVPALINERSNFFKMFKAMGVFNEPTDEELTRVFGTKESTTKILGTAVSLKIKHFEKQDGTKGHCIDSVAKLDPRLPQPVAVREPFIFTLSDPSLDVFKNKLSSYGRKHIMESLSAKSLGKEFHEFYINDLEAQKAKRADNKKGEIL